MADQTYEQLLSAVGFPAAEAASNIASIERRKQLAVGEVGIAGEQERKGINTGHEDRGMFNSGQRHESLANQQVSQQNKVAQLEEAAANDVTREQQAVNRAKAQAEAQASALVQQQAMFNQELQMRQQQLAAENEFRAREMSYAQEQANAQQQGYGGMDEEALRRLIYGTPNTRPLNPFQW